MLQSMTAFAKAKNSYSDLTVLIEVQSVNKKFLDVQLKGPPEWYFFEHEFRKTIASFIERGHVTVLLHVVYKDPEAVCVHVNEAYLYGLHSAMQKVAIHLGHSITGSELFAAVMREKAVLQSTVSAPDVPEVQEKVRKTLVDALVALTQMQAREGALIAKEFQGRLEALKELKAAIEALASTAPSRFRTKIETLLEEFAISSSETQERIAREVALAADKVDISEEISRLGFHIAHFSELLQSEKPQGKVLEFIMQEFVREINTIGSKCQDAQISKLVIAAKSEIEKMKEQVQNVQ